MSIFSDSSNTNSSGSHNVAPSQNSNGNVNRGVYYILTFIILAAGGLLFTISNRVGVLEVKVDNLEVLSRSQHEMNEKVDKSLSDLEAALASITAKIDILLEQGHRGRRSRRH